MNRKRAPADHLSRLSLCGAVLLLGMFAPPVRAAQHEAHHGQPKRPRHAP